MSKYLSSIFPPGSRGYVRCPADPDGYFSASGVRCCPCRCRGDCEPLSAVPCRPGS